MRLIALDPGSDPLWERLLAAPGATLFHSRPWIRAIRDAYGFRPVAYVAVDEAGTPKGGVAFCEIDDGLGQRLVSLPFSDVCDPLLLDADAWPLLRRRLLEHGVPVALRCLNESPLSRDPEFVVTKRARWHCIPVGDDAIAVRRRCGDATRRAIAKAERAGVTIRPLEGDEGLAAFLELHVRLRKRKYRMLAQPWEFFAAIAAHFKAGHLWHPLGAYLGNELLAATIYLRWGDTLFYKFNASNLDRLDVRPNDLLVWGGVALAASLGCRTLDLGPSDDDQPGLIRFKRAFGATERELRFLRWTPRGGAEAPAVALRQALGDLSQRLTEPDVPDEVTAAAGAVLYRYFA